MGQIHKSKLEIVVGLWLMAFLFFQCKEEKRTSGSIYPMTGLWYLITNDSSYREVIFSDSVKLSYDGQSGFVLFDYKMIGHDSLYFYKDALLITKCKINGDEIRMTLTDQYGSAVYYKVSKFNFDVVKLLNGDTTEIDQFRLEFAAREQDWFCSLSKCL
ncbi:MAG: hypothetical protein HOP30_02950 [Cyclobacteriaceae bacterium]|nr:hypothetical protein [Cyclobacteriaceae bacterium]